MQGPCAPPRRPQHQGDSGVSGGGDGGGGDGALEYWVGLGVGASSSEDERSFARSFACVADLFEVLVGRFVFVLGMAREGCAGSAVSAVRCDCSMS